MAILNELGTGHTNTRVEIPVKNIKDRQTYYGALDAQNKEFIIREYSAGNGENTVEFIKYLRLPASWTKNCFDLGWG